MSPGVAPNKIPYEDYPMSDLDSRVTKEISYSHNLFFRDSLANKNIKIDDRLSVVGIKQEVNAVSFLRGFIKQETPLLGINGTYLLYRYTGERKQFWEAHDSIRRFMTATRIYKNSRCDCDTMLSIENSQAKKYYRPFSYAKPFDMYWNKKSTIYSQAELNKVKLVYKRLGEARFSETIYYSKLYNAVKFFNHSYEENWTLLKTTLAFTSLESLFSDTDKADIVYKIALRTAYFLYPNDAGSRKKVFEFIKRGYDIRSYFIHGSDAEKQTNKIMALFEKEKNVPHYSFHHEFVSDLERIVSACLIKALLEKDYFDFFSKARILPKEEADFYQNLVLS